MKLLKGLLILDRSAVRSTFRQLVALSNDATSAFLVSGGSERRARPFLLFPSAPLICGGKSCCYPGENSIDGLAAGTGAGGLKAELPRQCTTLTEQ